MTLFLVKFKSDVCVLLTHFLCYVKTQFDRGVKIVITDNGIEFVNSAWAELFQTLVVVHKRTRVYIPYQNGVAERKHRHILEVARAMRFQAHNPLKYCGHCVLVAHYFKNRISSSVLNGASPFERIYNRRPSLEHLRIMGCLCYAKDVQVQNKFM